MHEVLTGDILAHVLCCIRVARDLASAGAACREWRAAADDPQLWRALCVAMWASSEGLLPRSSGDWRALYVQRSRPVRPPRPRTTLESCKLLLEVPGLLSRRRRGRLRVFTSMMTSLMTCMMTEHGNSTVVMGTLMANVTCG